MTTYTLTPEEAALIDERRRRANNEESYRAAALAESQQAAAALGPGWNAEPYGSGPNPYPHAAFGLLPPDAQEDSRDYAMHLSNGKWEVCIGAGGMRYTFSDDTPSEARDKCLKRIEESVRDYQNTLAKHGRRP
jgi:hypothetical protein